MDDKQILEEMKAERAKALEAAAKKKAEEQLTNFLKEVTDGPFKLPLANANAHWFVERLVGPVSQLPATIGSLSNLRAIVWSLLNQDNDEARKLNDEEIQEQIFELGKRLPMQRALEMVGAVFDAFSFEVASENPQ